MKKILITGANSYIGEAVEDYLHRWPEEYEVDVKDTVGWNPQTKDFIGYDVVFNVAGIAHIKETAQNRKLYYDINRNLVVKIAQKAKEGGVKQFILLSTMSVYGLKEGYITKETSVNPRDAYGKSKAEADKEISKLEDHNFAFACLRPPMIYGKGCKGNYQLLRKFVIKSPIFPRYYNERSMLYIGNLCFFVKKCIDEKKSGVFFPQNSYYMNTSKMVKQIAKENGNRVFLIKWFNWLIKLAPLKIFKQVFGSLIYEKVDLIDEYGFEDSIRLSEGNRYVKKVVVLSNEHSWTYNLRKETIQELLNREYEVVTVLPYGEKVELLKQMGCKYIDVPMFERRSKNIFKDLSLLRQYIFILRKEQPDVVLSYTIKPNIYGGLACQVLDIPYIANVTGLGTSIENGGLLSFLMLLLYRVGLKKATCVFFQNRANRALFFNRKVVNKNARIIPGSGVNINEYKYMPYPTDIGGIRFLFVGRIMRDKGIRELLQAFRIIRNQNENIFLDIVGFCDEDFSDLLTQAEKEGGVNYHGAQLNVIPFYEKCHCAILPSYHEGMANVMLEASSIGRPVITTNIPGCRETFSEGITGFGCKPKSVKSLLKAMKKIIGMSNSRREMMGKKAREKMVKKFDRKIIVTAYCDEIKKINENEGIKNESL